MDKHDQIVAEATETADASGTSVVDEVVRLQHKRIAELSGNDQWLRQLVELAHAAYETGSEDEMDSARVTIWREIERIEGNSVDLSVRESALLRGALPYPAPDKTNDEILTFRTEMIEAAHSLPPYGG